MPDLRRGQFITLLGGAAAWPLVTRAQQPAVLVIGMLHSQTQGSEATRIEAIQQGLREAGFIVGRNVTIEHRFADGYNERLPQLVAELVRLKVNVIFANTTPPALAAKAHDHPDRVLNRRRSCRIGLGCQPESAWRQRHWRDHLVQQARRQTNGAAV
jgi:hypothetical protein